MKSFVKIFILILTSVGYSTEIPCDLSNQELSSRNEYQKAKNGFVLQTIISNKKELYNNYIYMYYVFMKDCKILVNMRLGIDRKRNCIIKSGYDNDSQILTMLSRDNNAKDNYLSLNLGNLDISEYAKIKEALNGFKHTDRVIQYIIDFIKEINKYRTIKFLLENE